MMLDMTPWALASLRMALVLWAISIAGVWMLAGALWVEWYQERMVGCGAAFSFTCLGIVLMLGLFVAYFQMLVQNWGWR